LGQTYRLRIDFHEGTFGTMLIGQSVKKGHQAALDPVGGSLQQAPVLRDTSGAYYVEVKPLSLGSLVLDASGRFADGASWLQRVTMYVLPPSQPPRKLIIGWSSNPDGFSGLLHLNLAHPRREILVPNALYDESPALIRLDDNSVRFGVRTNNGQNVLTVDPATGDIKPIGTGEALVEVTYGGLTAPVCVVVSIDGNRPDHGRSDCRDLLRPDQTLGRVVREP